MTAREALGAVGDHAGPAVALWTEWSDGIPYAGAIAWVLLVALAWKVCK